MAMIKVRDEKFKDVNKLYLGKILKKLRFKPKKHRINKVRKYGYWIKVR